MHCKNTDRSEPSNGSKTTCFQRGVISNLQNILTGNEVLVD